MPNFLQGSSTEIGPLFNVVKFQGTHGLKFLVLCFYLFLPDVSLIFTYRVFYRLLTVILQLYVFCINSSAENTWPGDPTPNKYFLQLIAFDWFAVFLIKELVP